jgi:hypothetical protein
MCSFGFDKVFSLRKSLLILTKSLGPDEDSKNKVPIRLKEELLA